MGGPHLLTDSRSEAGESLSGECSQRRNLLEMKVTIATGGAGSGMGRQFREDCGGDSLGGGAPLSAATVVLLLSGGGPVNTQAHAGAALT